MSWLPVPEDAISTLTISRSRRADPIIVVALGGELDVVTTPGFDQYIADVLTGRESAEVLILDLTELTFLSAAGLRSLHETCVRAARRGMRPVLVSPAGLVRRALDRALDVVAGRTGGQAVAELHDTRRAAIEAAGVRRTASLPRSTTSAALTTEQRARVLAGLR